MNNWLLEGGVADQQTLYAISAASLINENTRRDLGFFIDSMNLPEHPEQQRYLRVETKVAYSYFDRGIENSEAFLRAAITHFSAIYYHRPQLVVLNALRRMNLPPEHWYTLAYLDRTIKIFSPGDAPIERLVPKDTAIPYNSALCLEIEYPVSL